MKYGREFSAKLAEDYPQHWVDSAISYKQLKKCIKDVQRELEDLGLSKDDMLHLLHHGDGHEASQCPGKLHYSLDRNGANFQPQLVFITDEDGSIDASLAQETRKRLQKAIQTSRRLSSQSCDEPFYLDKTDMASSTDARAITFPLTADAAFFKLLKSQVLGLNELQAEEEEKLNGEICELGREIAKVSDPTSRRRTDMDAWREILAMYTDSRIFFSTSEREPHTRNASAARKQLQLFSDNLVQSKLPERLKLKSSKVALEQFIQINMTLLKHLNFQELNVTAMTKILKKFDKRTALTARHTFPTLLAAESFSPSTLAKSACYQISQNVVRVIPPLDDYLCPVCFDIAWKPIRLRCNHIFCIRCLIKMQRDKEDHCPLCRGKVVMEADSFNLDHELMAFLRRYFPKEVKERQKRNELEATVDRFGEGFVTYRCNVM